MGPQFSWENACLASRRSRVRLTSGPPIYARLTQLVECLPYKEEVGGSSPSASTILWKSSGSTIGLSVKAGYIARLYVYSCASLLIFIKKYDIIYIVSEGSGSATTVLMTRGRYPVAKASQKSWVSALTVHMAVSSKRSGHQPFKLTIRVRVPVPSPLSQGG